MSKISINTDEMKTAAEKLCAGDEVLLTGYIYTARDAAHKRIMQMLENGEKPPFELDGATVYYAGPTPTKAGMAIGSCGPTTSSRMDVFTPTLLSLGLTCMIGKGERSEEVCKSICDNGAVYLCAIGGAGALAAKCVESMEVIAFEELGCESVKKLYVKDFPLICAIDCKGGNLYRR
ncbi:MAG: fumarate hydratase C-terminal domain-containing protein [Clostridia bacterium]|nr:fumarate hydratase C-terminal domain-containing protein [Clostridia bacterium]